MDKQRFRQACETVGNMACWSGSVGEAGASYADADDTGRARNSIGTLGEKTLHAVIKHYLEPDEANHEVRVGRFVADIATDKGITEIQTRSLDKMRKKLASFLETSPVTVVYPLPKTKWLLWIDEQTGEVTKRRKSPKQGAIYDAVPELYRIKPFLDHPRLRLCILLIDMEEYRYLNGWSGDRKKGSTRYDRIPTDLIEEKYFGGAGDYLEFIPAGLPGQFTTKDLKSAARINMRISQLALNILHHTGAVKRVGKRGNLHIYERAW